MTEKDRVRHDFANHLTVILGFTEILLDTADESRRRDLEEIRRAAMAALDLLAQLTVGSPDQSK
jgi:hypothetical protein